MDKEKTQLLKFLREFKIKVNKKTKLKKMILFGSRARGNAHVYSDVDLLLISDDYIGKKSFKRSPPYYLLWDSPLDVDIICLTQEELSIKEKEIGIIREAVEEGIVI